MKCPKCKSKNVDVNGIFYRCLNCGHIDDTTFNMLNEENGFIKIQEKK
jgi:formate dehydrogenase maturation protein FdhE